MPFLAAVVALMISTSAYGQATRAVSKLPVKASARLQLTAQVEPVSEGTVRPLNVCSGCSEPIAAPRRASGLRTSLPTAPLVCTTIFPRQALLPIPLAPCVCRRRPERLLPIRASASAVSARTRSGVAIRIRSAASTASDKAACGWPLPIRRRAARAVCIERVITGPMCQPC